MQKKKRQGRVEAKKLARLESQVDLLEAELTHLHAMLVRCGFPDGIRTLKETVQEVLEGQSLPLERD